MKKFGILFLILSMMVVLTLDAEARGKSHDIYREHNRVVRYHRCQNDSLLARLLGLDSGCERKKHKHYHSYRRHNSHFAYDNRVRWY